MRSNTTEGLQVLLDSLEETETVINHYFLHQYTGTTIEDLVDMISECIEEQD